MTKTSCTNFVLDLRSMRWLKLITVLTLFLPLLGGESLFCFNPGMLDGNQMSVSTNQHQHGARYESKELSASKVNDSQCDGPCQMSCCLATEVVVASEVSIGASIGFMVVTLPSVKFGSLSESPEIPPPYS